MEKKRMLTDDYQLIAVNGFACNLGFGAYGSVQLAQSIKTKKTVAIKKIYRKLAIKEVEIHQALNHPNIIKLIDFYFDQNLMTTFIVLEYAKNGTLFDFIKQHGLKDKKIIKKIYQSICQAVDYLHSKNIMHRDIKPQNILLDQYNHAKLCDFGFAAGFQPRMTLCGTVEYMSPQMILRKQHNHKVDIWSLGILLFQLIEGHAPFQGTLQQQILQKMKKPLYFSNKFTEEQIEIVHYILRVNPKQRPQLSQILKLSWFLSIKRFSEEMSKRSTMQQQKQSKIKILKVRQLPEEPQYDPTFIRGKSNPEYEIEKSLHNVTINHMKNQKISLKKWRRS